MGTPHGLTIEERFWRKVEIGDPDECWSWTAFIDPDGYGLFHDDDNHPRRAHRYSCEWYVEPIPEGMTVDHVCHNEDASCPGGVACLHRRCVNPAHLSIEARGQNALNGGRSPSALNAQKEQCINGHDFDEENTRWWRGHRICRACHRALMRKRRTEGRSK